MMDMPREMYDSLLEWAKDKGECPGHYLLGMSGSGYIREFGFNRNYSYFSKEVNPKDKTPILQLSEIRVEIVSDA